MTIKLAPNPSIRGKAKNFFLASLILTAGIAKAQDSTSALPLTGPNTPAAVKTDTARVDTLWGQRVIERTDRYLVLENGDWVFFTDNTDNRALAHRWGVSGFLKLALDTLDADHRLSKPALVYFTSQSIIDNARINLDRPEAGTENMAQLMEKYHYWQYKDLVNQIFDSTGQTQKVVRIFINDSLYRQALRETYLPQSDTTTRAAASTPRDTSEPQGELEIWDRARYDVYLRSLHPDTLSATVPAAAQPPVPSTPSTHPKMDKLPIILSK